MKTLVVVDAQNDFVSGALKSFSSLKTIKNIKNKVSRFKGEIYFTQDTHDSKTYLKSYEGINLPIKHCIKGSEGWKIVKELQKFIKKNNVIEKGNFYSLKLINSLKKLDKIEKIEEITLVGFCTDICIISNAFLLKAYFPEINIYIDEKCCAGTSKKNHDAAIKVLKSSQFKIL